MRGCRGELQLVAVLNDVANRSGGADLGLVRFALQNERARIQL
jgi:hypothetical protein